MNSSCLHIKEQAMVENKGTRGQERGYCARHHGEKYATRNLGNIASPVIFIRGFITITDLNRDKDLLS